MTREEALRLLGLDEDAVEADIKLAYRELAQILHPDKYADNKRLSDRATEQFKRINEAYQTLLGGKGTSRTGAGAKNQGKGTSGSGSSAAGSGTSTKSSGTKGSGYKQSGSKSSGASSGAYYDQASALRARLAGIAAAKTQLTVQLDAELSRRRTGYYMVAGGILCMVIGETATRFIEPLGGTLLIWGAISLFNAQSNVKKLREYIEKLEADRKKCEKELAKL